VERPPEEWSADPKLDSDIEIERERFRQASHITGQLNGHDGLRLTNAAQWLGSTQTDRSAEPRPNLFNVMLALREDPRISHLFAYDDMLRAPVLLADVPGIVIEHGGWFQPRPVRDPDVTALQEFLQREGIETLGRMWFTKPSTCGPGSDPSIRCGIT
jgi:hypothetical protein